MTMPKMGTTVRGVTLKGNSEDKIIVQSGNWSGTPWAILITETDVKTLYFVSGTDEIDFILLDSFVTTDRTWMDAMDKRDALIAKEHKERNKKK